MRPLLLTSVIVAVAAAVSPSAAGYRLALAPGDAAPRIELPMAPTGESRYHDWAETSWTVVNFWATWCEPCKREMPSLASLAKRHAGKLAVIGLLVDPRADDDEARRFLAETSASYPVVRANADAIKSWGGIGMLPTTFLVDRNGKIARRYVGASPEQIEGLVKDVEDVLAGRPLGSMMLPDSPTLRPSPSPPPSP